MPILTQKKPRPWQTADDGGKGNLSPAGYYLGGGSTPLEVALANAPSRPTEGDVRTLWKKRKGNTPSPLLLIVTWPGSTGERASVCGPVGDTPPVYSDRDLGQVERIAANALAEPDHHAATRFLAAYLPEEAGALRNLALFSTHHLVERVPQRSDWPELCKRGEALVGLRRGQLLKALGFTVEPKGHAAVLRAAGNARALAVFLDDAENPDATSGRFNSMTPVSWAIASAAVDNIPYVVVTRGPQIRIYTTRSGAGSAGKGGTGAFLEVNLALMTDVDSGYLPLLFSAEALQDGGDFESLLSESHDYAAELGTRLRERVYGYAVPMIADALIAHHEATGGNTDEASLEALYDQALLVLFRLLFVAYAEDRDLLPLRTNGHYRQRSLKQIARDLSVEAEHHGSLDDIEFDENATDLWDNVRSLWTAIDKGRKDWNVPPYNGGMFSSDPDVDVIGAALAELVFTNADFGPALVGLLVDETTDGQIGPVDFASLDVREFGTIYEGLLESNLAVAPVALTLGKDDTWIPAGPRDDVWVEEGAVYLHNKSGARKTSGSYFTKPFAVNHLLDHALEPALADHIARLHTLLDDGDDVAAAEAFFDFRCADLAMGSGHFLVAAVDRIERRLSEFLVDHHIGGVHDELARLRAAAEQNLAAVGIPSEGADTNALLRRQIARRCIYGSDLNSTAVELARLALWLHTFVRGLPLTSLNHGLVKGNSLTGIATIDEAIAVLDPDGGTGAVSFVRLAVDEALEAARGALKRFADTSEATAAEVKQARLAHAEAQSAVAVARQLLDFAVAVRLGQASRPTTAFDVQTLLKAATTSDAAAVAEELEALHFPVAFPEVFSRPRPGFDCLLGNPPWETVKVETHKFWTLRFPGLRSMTVGQRDKKIGALRASRPDLVTEFDSDVARTEQYRSALHASPYPGLGTGDIDLYEVFAWRNWHLTRSTGHIGVVMPRSLFASGGTSEWRKEVLRHGTITDMTLLVNNGNWVFKQVHPQYTIALLSVVRTHQDAGVRVQGPFRSLADYVARPTTDLVDLPVDGILRWSPTAIVPLLPSQDAARVFLTIQDHGAPLRSPRHGWRVRNYNELHATREKPLMETAPPSTDGLWPVYKGETIGLWNSDTGIYYAWAKPDKMLKFLHERRKNQVATSSSAFYGMPKSWWSDPATLPCLFPRLAWRMVARATDTRTFYAALLPPNVFVAHHCYCLFFPGSDPRSEAFILGVMCSLPFDWVARRLVEINLTAELVNGFPFPLDTPGEAISDRVVAIAGRLAALDRRYADWGKAVGVPVGSVTDPTEKDALTAELDAAVAHLYGLDEGDVETIFSTFHVGWDYKGRLAAVVDHFRRLS